MVGIFHRLTRAALCSRSFDTSYPRCEGGALASVTLAPTDPYAPKYEAPHEPLPRSSRSPVCKLLAREHRSARGTGVGYADERIRPLSRRHPSARCAGMSGPHLQVIGDPHQGRARTGHAVLPHRRRRPPRHRSAHRFTVAYFRRPAEPCCRC